MSTLEVFCVVFLIFFLSVTTWSFISYHSFREEIHEESKKIKERIGMLEKGMPLSLEKLKKDFSKFKSKTADELEKIAKFFPEK